jgi:molecular chaperone GrpE
LKTGNKKKQGNSEVKSVKSGNINDSNNIENSEAISDFGNPNDDTVENEVENLEEKLTQLQSEFEKTKDHWLRSEAEKENLNKRLSTEIQNAHNYSIKNFVESLLPVKDSLEAALDQKDAPLDTFIKGTELTLKLLNESFSKSDVIEINPVDEKLDPNFHQAMSLIDSNLELNTIVSVIQKGYKIGDRLVRPALVSVSNGKKTSNKED